MYFNRALAYSKLKLLQSSVNDASMSIALNKNYIKPYYLMAKNLENERTALLVIDEGLLIDP